MSNAAISITSATFRALDGARRENGAARLPSDLSAELCRAVEQAAIAAARTIGLGDRHRSDLVAVAAMRRVLGSLPIDGTIVIGEGERDAAPMLFIGEKLGTACALGGSGLELDIAVDPLEGTNLCATGEPNAIAVLAAAERGGLLHAPDLYMEKLIVGPAARDMVSLDAPVARNVGALGWALGLRVEELEVVVLDRPRHARLIGEIRATGARVRLISDGDVCAGLATADPDSGVHAVMGTGGAPEGVLTAAAMRCLGGEIHARLVIATAEHAERCRGMGISDARRVYRARDLASGEHIVFAATGVTDGSLLDGVRFGDGELRTSSLVMHTQPSGRRRVESVHALGDIYPPLDTYPPLEEGERARA
jgi:fructose-1,6-bisphosphatase class II